MEVVITIIIGLAVLGCIIKHWHAIFSLIALGIPIAIGYAHGWPWGVFWLVVIFGVIGQFTGNKPAARNSAWTGHLTVTGHCHVYVIADGFCHKVGIADNVDRRLATLQTGHPNKLELVRVFTLPNRHAALAVEREAHRRLDRHRVGGEWFNAERNMIVATVTAVARTHGGKSDGFDSYEEAAKADAWTPSWARS
jgi:Meiotically up-regulated gene 113